MTKTEQKLGKICAFGAEKLLDSNSQGAKSCDELQFEVLDTSSPAVAEALAPHYEAALKHIIFADKEQALVDILTAYTMDIVQSLAGLHIPDIEERKQKFCDAHTELRQLLGKEPRGVQHTNN